MAPPPFNAEDALQRLHRDLRALGLTERPGVFERRGVAIARAAVAVAAQAGPPHLAAAVVRKPSRNSPEWQARTLRSAAEVRDFTQHVKKLLAQWSDRDE